MRIWKGIHYISTCQVGIHLKAHLCKLMGVSGCGRCACCPGLRYWEWNGRSCQSCSSRWFSWRVLGITLNWPGKGIIQLWSHLILSFSAFLKCLVVMYPQYLIPVWRLQYLFTACCQVEGTVWCTLSMAMVLRVGARFNHQHGWRCRSTTGLVSTMFANPKSAIESWCLTLCIITLYRFMLE